MMRTCSLCFNYVVLYRKEKTMAVINYNEWEFDVDVTIVDSEFSWTYSKTHEENLGPYYYER